jgi:hypothetical protein
LHACAYLRLIDKVDGALFQNARANPAFNVRATSPLEHHRVDSTEMQKLR